MDQVRQFLKRQYKLSFKYIQEHLLIIFYVLCIISILAYYATAIGMAYYGIQDPKLTLAALHMKLMAYAQTYASKVSSGYSWVHYFMHNMKANAASLALGFLPMYFYSAIVSISNAVVLAVSTVPLVQVSGKSLFLVVLCSVCPHGIGEIPVSLLCDAYGIYSCALVTGWIFRYKKRKTIWQQIRLCAKEELRMYIFIVMPVILISGIIEAYITPIIMEFLG